VSAGTSAVVCSRGHSNAAGVGPLANQSIAMPSSVHSVHLSGTAVACSLMRPTRDSCGVGLTPVPRRGLAPYLALLRAGFGQPVCLHTHRRVFGHATAALLPHHFTLAHLAVGAMFLCHFPSGRPAWALPSALPCGTRTFLNHALRQPRTLGPLHRHCSTRGDRKGSLTRP
jgi:hypothetical protein